MKKIISSVLAFVMIAGLFALIPLPAVAADTTQSTTEVGKVEAGYKPVGTAITTAEEFAAMEANGNYYLAKDIAIDASYATAFTGVFDGNGHTVTISAPMFTKLNGTVKNLTIEGSASQTGTVNAIESYVAAIARGTDKNVSVLVENVANNATITGEYRAGGLIGQVFAGSNAKFINCVNNGKITGTNMVGGIIAYVQGYVLEMRDCVNNGDVSIVAGKDGNCGGLVGRHGDDTLYDTNSAIDAERFANIVNCKNIGDVSSSTQAGGIIGHARSATINIAYCVNEGNITSNNGQAAGIAANVGSTKKVTEKDDDGNDAEVTKYMLVTLNVTNCVNTGNVTMKATSLKSTDTKLASGIVGYVFGSGKVGFCRIDKCINLGTVSSTWFASQLLGYSNSTKNTLKNSIAAGKVEKYNNATKAMTVVFGLSNAKSANYPVSNLYYLENDGTEYYSYSTGTASNRVKLATYLNDNKDKGKITTFTAAELASGKIGAQFNKLVNREMLYQNIGTDAAPTTDSTHAKIDVATKKSVKSAADFAAMEVDGNYILDADIVISESYGTFSGTFDGNGHTVTTTVPLFNKLRGATVKNLVIEGNINDSENNRVGALSMNASKFTVENVINNANIKSTYNKQKSVKQKDGTYKDEDDPFYGGGLIGAANEDEGYAYAHEYSYFTNCINNGSVTYENNDFTTGAPRVAGLVGNVARYQHAVYTNCTNNGNVTVNTSKLTVAPYIGGISGSSFGGEFYNCINNGDLYSDATALMGGILAVGSPSVQNTDQSSTAVGCVNTGNLTIKAGKGSGTIGGIFGNCGNTNPTKSAHTVYTVEKCVNFGTLTSDGDKVGAMIGYVWGNNNIVNYSYGVVRGCVNAGKLVGTKSEKASNPQLTARAAFISHFIGYVNANRTIIENSYGLGTLENANDEYNVIFGLSGDTATAFKVNNIFLAPNDGTTNYSYALDAMVDGPEKDENNQPIKVLDDRSRNRLDLFNEKVAGKVTVLTTEELASGKVTYTCNELLGKRFFYQNLGVDAAPTVDRTHAPVNLYGSKYFNINEGGASVRVVGDSATVGVRFRSLIKKDIFDAMKADVAEIGVIIAPKAIADAAGEMTFEALDAYKAASGKTNVYLTLKRSGEYATSFSDEELSDGAYAIKGSLVNVKNASMEFTAVGYVKLADGTVFYGSTDTNSAKAVATDAVADTKSAAEAEYMYEVAEGVFSPYTKEAYENLKALANAK